LANITISNTFDKQLYTAELVKTAENDAFWKRFTGGSSSIVNVDNRPEKGGGAQCNYAIRPYLAPRSVTNGPLDGQERQLSYFKDSLVLDKHREAVIDDGEQQEIESFFSITSSMEAYIKQWITDIYDALCFKAIFYEGGSPNNFFANAAANEAALVTGDTMSNNDLSKLFTIASTGKSRTFEPLRPINIDGGYYYVYLCHPDVARDIRLTLESDWNTAMPRSEGNPLFKNMTMMWNNIIVYADRRCPIYLGGSGGAVPIATGALLGQQAIQQIVGKNAELVKGDKDWGDQKGYAAKYILGCKAPEFNSARYGSILVKSARINLSGDDNLAEINYNAISTSNQ